MSKGLRWTQADLDAAMSRNRHLAAENQVVSPMTQTDQTPPEVTTKKVRGMNKTEEEYSRILESKKAKGEIQEWEYEPFRLRYGTNAFYKPDFVVILSGALMTISELRELSEVSGLELASAGSRHFPNIQALSRCTESDEKLIQIIEIKGGHIFDAAKPRFKAAQLRYPWAEFQMIQKRKGEWVRIL